MEPSISVDQDLCRGGSGRLYLLIAPHPAVDRLMDALAVRLALAADASAHQFQQSTPPLSASSVYLHILDSGNRFDLHGIARGIARGIAHSGSRGGSESIMPAALPPECPEWTRPAPTVEAILQRIRVARAFTCYQAEALLAGAVESCRGGSVHTQFIHLDRSRPAPIAGAKLVRLDEPRAAPTADPPATILAPSLLAPFADENVPRGERLRLLGRCLQHLKRLAASAPVLVSAAPPAGAGIANAEAAGGGATGADTAEFLARLEAAADQVWRFESGVVVGAGCPSTALRMRPAPIGPAPTDGQLRMF